MNCNKCGNVLEDGAVFCGVCGAKVGENVVQNNGVNVGAQENGMNIQNMSVQPEQALQENVQSSGDALAYTQATENVVNAGLGESGAIEAPMSESMGVAQEPIPVPSTSQISSNDGQASVGSAPMQASEEVKETPVSSMNSLGGSVPSESSVSQVLGGTQAPASEPLASQVSGGTQASVDSIGSTQVPQGIETPASSPQAFVQPMNESQTEVSQGVQGNAPMQANPQGLNNNVNNNQKKTNKTPFFVAAGGLGAVMVLLICLIATGGIKLNFTVSKGGEKSASDNQTINQEKKEEKKTENSNKQDTTTERTTEKTTAAPVSNSGNYLEVQDMSVYIPDTFEYDFDKSDRVFQLFSNAKRQMFTMQIYMNKYSEVLPQADYYKTDIVKNGGRVVSEGESTKNGLKYYYVSVSNEGVSAEVIIMEAPNVGCIISVIYTDFATESAYLNTLYEIASKTKSSGNSQSFAPDSNNAVATEFKVNKEMTHTFE